MDDEYRDKVAIACGFNRTPQESELSDTERQLFNCAALAINDRDRLHTAAKEMVEGYGEMEKHHEDPILAHYIGIRLHNAMEDLRALVLPDYTPKYEPSLDADDLADQEKRTECREDA